MGVLREDYEKKSEYLRPNSGDEVKMKRDGERGRGKAKTSKREKEEFLDDKREWKGEKGDKRGITGKLEDREEKSITSS